MELRIVLDTNSIYTASSGYLLGYEISQMVRNTRGDDNLQLRWFVPQLVVDERRYQIRQQAIRLRGPLKDFERIIGREIGIDEATMIDLIDRNIDRQVQEHNLQVCR
jgi:hypothetical protein